jgi:hypothetical protein
MDRAQLIVLSHSKELTMRQIAKPNSLRRGSVNTRLLAAIGCFAILLAATFGFTGSQTPAKQSLKITTEVPTANNPSARDTRIDDLEFTTNSTQYAAALAEDMTETVPATTQTPVARPKLQEAIVSSEHDPSKLRLEQIQAHLRFGEFGRALEMAQAEIGPQERSQLLRLVADAQIDSAEFSAALTSIRQIPIPEQRRLARALTASRQSLAGGVQADFAPLIDLIQQETFGPWVEIDGLGGTISQFATGVVVDPQGLLSRQTRDEHTDRLKELGIRARVADLNEEMARPSNLRLVSLTRLEREIARRLESGQPVVETMSQLAGLTRVRYVFINPNEKDIVIGGPAEGWRYNENGIPIGIESGLPILQLDDLVTVLRTFSADGLQIFGCTINPRKEGLKALKAYVERSNARGPLGQGAGVRSWVNKLHKKLGLQDIKFQGIPPTSHVARVIIEADYRMKLIGIGKLDGGLHIPNFFDLMTDEEKENSNLDALRWMLTTKFDSVLHSRDRSVFEINGSSVLCVSENQFLTDQGERVQTGKAEPTNRQFAANFTKHYHELSERDLVFAELQGIFDLGLVAALLWDQQAAEEIGWDRGVFAHGAAFKVATFEAPTTVDSVVNHQVFNRKHVVVQVAGGVEADLMSVVRDKSMLHESPRLKNFAAKSKPLALPAGRWWWDAAK